MSAHYRHTQVGWVVLVVFAALGFVVLLPAGREGADAVRVPLLAVAALVLLLFGALSVEVDQATIRLRFGIGLIRKRIALADVSGFRAVRNPWYSGWGIRLGPRGVLWNVSGFDAVELDLTAGRHFRIGTDEPERLVSAITQARGIPATPPSGSGRPAASGGLGRGALVALVVGLALVGWAFWAQARPVGVRVGPQGVEIETLLYGTTLPAAEITALSLEPALPRILTRTNGFAAAGTLRGHFRVEGLGDGRLYVEQGHSPYVLVRLRQGFVFLNFREPDKTRALFEALARQWPDRASAP
jgi:hypothetical protein